MLRALTVHDRFNPRRCRSLRHPLPRSPCDSSAWNALIKFVVVHGLLLHADLVLNQEVGQGLAVDQGDRPRVVSWLLLADPENPALEVSDLSFFIR